MTPWHLSPARAIIESYLFAPERRLWQYQQEDCPYPRLYRYPDGAEPHPWYPTLLEPGNHLVLAEKTGELKQMLDLLMWCALKEQQGPLPLPLDALGPIPAFSWMQEHKALEIHHDWLLAGELSQRDKQEALQALAQIRQAYPQVKLRIVLGDTEPSSAQFAAKSNYNVWVPGRDYLPPRIWPGTLIPLLEQIKKKYEQLDILGGDLAGGYSWPLEAIYQPLLLLREAKQEKLRHQEYADSRPDCSIRQWETTQCHGQQRLYQHHSLHKVITQFAQVVQAEAPAQVPRLIVSGPPGSGKSSLLQYLAWQLANGHCLPGKEPLLPVLVSLPDWEQQGGDLAAYLATKHDLLRQKGLPTHTWQKWLSQGQLFLLLDGYDAISPGVEFQKHLRAALNWRQCPLVLTCRPGHLKQCRSLAKVLPVFLLAGMDSTARNHYIAQFARLSGKDVAPTLIPQLDQFPLVELAPLATNPLLLAIICALGNDRPRTRAVVYAKILRKMLERSRKSIKWPGEESPVDKLKLLQRIAAYFFLPPARKLLFTREEFSQACRTALEQEGCPHTQTWVQALIDDIVVNSGIVQEICRRDDRRAYFFLHLTFYQYLVAAYLARLINTVGWEALVPERSQEQGIARLGEWVQQHSCDPDGETVSVSLAGQLNKPAELLQRLIGQDDPLHHGLTVAALCLSAIPPEARCPAMVKQISTKVQELWCQAVHTKHKALEQQICRAFPALVVVDAKVRYQGRTISWGEYFTTLLTHQQRNWQSAALRAGQALGAAATHHEPFLLALVHLLKHQHKRVCEAALQVVRSVGAAAGQHESFLLALVHLLKHQYKHVREAALQAVELLGPAVAGNTTFLLALLDLLKHQHKRVREAAIAVVQIIGPSVLANKAFLSALLDLLKHQHKHVREAALQVLEPIGTVAAGHESFMLGLAALLKHQYQRIRDTALRAVEAMGAAVAESEPFMRRLPELLIHQHEDVRAAAVAILKGLGPAAAAHEHLMLALADILTHQHWRVRDTAVWAVEAIGPAAVGNEAFMLALAGLLKHQHENVRNSALRAVKAMGAAVAGHRPFMRRLPELLTHQYEDVRAAAMTILKGLGPAAVEHEPFMLALIDLLKHHHEERRAAALKVVQAMGSAAVEHEPFMLALIDLLKHHHEERRAAALKVVQAMGPTVAQNEQFMLGLADTLKHHQYEGVGDAAMKAVQAIGAAAAAHEPIMLTLPDLLKHEYSYVRYAAVKAVQAIGPAAAGYEEIMIALSDLLEDHDKDVRCAAAEAVQAMVAGREGI